MECLLKHCGTSLCLQLYGYWIVLTSRGLCCTFNVCFFDVITYLQSCWRCSLALLPLGTASCVGTFPASEILYPPWFHIELIGLCVLHAIMCSSSLFLIGHLQGIIVEFSLQSKWCVFQWLQWMSCIQAVSGGNWYGQGATAQITTPLYVDHSMPLL